MVWWCDKHKQHSIDDVCWECDRDEQEPLDDAFLAGWAARDNLYKPAHERWNTERDNALADFRNKKIHKGKLRGTHDT